VYPILVGLHLLAAVAWIGGMLFLSLVLVPVLKREPYAAHRPTLFPIVARRFRSVVWLAIATLLMTGPLLLHQHGWSLVDPERWPSILSVKLSLVALVLAVNGAHDLVVGPRVSAVLQQPPASRSTLDRTLLAWSPWIARSTLLLGLAVLFAAAALARN
jgi:uncharacterized membrane protein